MGAKYIYYNGSEYSYIYDSECDGGEYSSYSKEDGWDSVMFYIAGNAGNGYYCLYWQGSDDQESEEPTESESLAICGTYNVTSFEGYSSYWFVTTTTDWIEFSYGDYEVEINQVEGNQVALTGLLQEGLSFYGEYNAEDSTIIFPVQQVYGESNPEYYLCAEVWDGNNMILDPDMPAVAVVNEDGSITFDGWSLLYVYPNGSTWGYLCWVKTLLTPIENGPNGIAGIEADENAPVEYYNLNGVRVDNPTHGIYIVRQGSKVTKRAIR